MIKFVDHVFMKAIIKILKNLKGKKEDKEKNMINLNKEMKTIKKKGYTTD